MKKSIFDKVISLIKRSGVQIATFVLAAREDDNNTECNITLPSKKLGACEFSLSDITEINKAISLMEGQFPYLLKLGSEVVGADTDDEGLHLRMSFRPSKSDVISSERTLPFKGRCAFCGHEIEKELTVPNSAAGPLRRDKNGTYRIWDGGLHQCQCKNEALGTTREVFLTSKVYE